MKAAEDGDVEGALVFFSRAIEMAPSRPSGYNNRAQGLRLQGKIEGGNATETQSVSVKMSSHFKGNWRFISPSVQ